MSTMKITKLIYLGFCEIKGGNLGLAFAPVEAVDPEKSLISIKRSPFSASRRSYVVGGVYEAKASVVSGMIESLNLSSLAFLERFDHTGLADLEMQSAAINLMIKRNRLESKVKKSPAAVAEISALAALRRRTEPSLKGMMEQVIIDLIRAESTRQLTDELRKKGSQI